MSNISGITGSGNSIVIDGREQTNVPSKEAPIEIKNGSTLSGKVLSVTDSEGERIANIDIGNATISAKLSEGMGLKEGQVLNFAVRGSGANGITITPLLENTSIYQSTMKALSAAGLEITNDNLQMVKEMMEAGLPIDKSSLLEMSKNLNTYSDTSVSTLVEMKSLNIPINENNIEQYSSYKNYEHQVTMEMTQIMDELPNAFNTLMESGNTTAAVNLYGEVLKAFAEGAEISASVNPEIVNPEAANTEALKGDATNMGLVSPEAADTELLNSETIKSEITNSGIVNSDSASAEAFVQASEENVADGNPVLSGEVQKGLPNEGAAQNVVNQNSEDKNAQANIKFSTNFVNNLENIGISEKTIQNLIKETGSGSLDVQKMLFKELAGAFENADLSNPVEMASWKKLFSSDEYNKLQKENITNQWLLKPGDVEKKENIDNLYQRLGVQAKALAETISNTLGSESKLAQSANNLSNNLDFMNQLNQMFQYIQLPLQMTGQNANGDLYVYRNKNKKMSEDGSVSAILHLDMESLGPVDVYVKLKDTKVTTNFYVADDSVIELINDNIHILHERLEKRGYSMQANLMLHSDKGGENDAVDELLAVSRTPLLSTTAFDARA
ncbi:flagellar hook-length control protein FliK [Butyrivibrio sp. VCB2006]|uniref:flagellar hook-length control protein FliK n=1 Tax=Butyrivibrio sp. VCB2006 TaxID=1280679 RepID=UPI00041F077E|nr:flagellar hook-length control protein FliK [Butyrivibrio sp. VCB2006]